MKNLKSAYELANERIIAPREEPVRDDDLSILIIHLWILLKFQSFPTKETKMVEERETQSMTDKLGSIKVNQPERYRRLKSLLRFVGMVIFWIMVVLLG